MLTGIGKKRKSKAWVFFGNGLVVPLGYLPLLQFVIGWISFPKDHFDFRLINVWEQLYFCAPMIVGALCIFRGISIWAEEGMSGNPPNETPEATPGQRPSSAPSRPAGAPQL